MYKKHVGVPHIKKKVQQGDIQEKERAAKRELLRQKKIAKRENCAWRRK